MAIVALKKISFHQMSDDLGVSLRRELVPFLDQLTLEHNVVFDDAVVHHDNAPAAVAMRVSVFLRGTAVSRPTCVTDAVGAIQWLQTDRFFEIAQFAFGAAYLQAFAISGDGDSCRIISAIFQSSKAVNDDRHDPLLTYISHNAAHGCLLLRSAGEPNDASDLPEDLDD